MKDGFAKRIDGLIRAGRTAEARRALSRLRATHLRREERLALAALARRAGLPFLTLRLLAALVRPAPKRPVRASAAEQAEYAAALVRIGASREALEMLSGLDSRELPQVHLYRSHALFTQWDYAAAIPVLQAYLAAPLDDYQRIIGQVNLASALVHERQQRAADRLLAELETLTVREGLAVLHGNTLERRAELALQLKDWRAAEDALRRAESAVAGAGGLDAFFVRKWRVILELYRAPRGAGRAIEAFQQEAAARRHWETVRECDAHRAIVYRDLARLRKVVFGTPYPSYRRRLLEDFGGTPDLGDMFEWHLGPAARTARVWDPFREAKDLKPGQLKHRLLRALLGDFYRPFPIAHLFAEAYPGERFSITGSRARVHVGVRELRQWLRGRRCALRIIESGGGYRVGASRALAVRIPSAGWWEANQGREWSRVRERSDGGDFTAPEVARWLGIARRTALERLRDGVERGLVERAGAGPTTRYRLIKRPPQ